MKWLCPPLPSPFKWIQLHLETISPACLNPSRVRSIGLARACPYLMPSLVSLMSKQLPSKSWASFSNFFHCFSAAKRYLNCKMTTSINVFWLMPGTVLLLNLFYIVYCGFFKIWLSVFLSSQRLSGRHGRAEQVSWFTKVHVDWLS